MPMIMRCAVIGCENTPQIPGIKFFCFPNDKELSDLWVLFTKNEYLKQLLQKGGRRAIRHYRVCSSHFVDTDFQNNLMEKLLRGRVPTLRPAEAGACSVENTTADSREVCSVFGCLSTSDDPSVNFFHFPRTKELCLEWVNFCRNPELRDFCKSGAMRMLSQKKMCSKHFLDSCFQNKLKLKLLRGVVPSIEGPVAATFLSSTHPLPHNTIPHGSLPSISVPGPSIITSTPSRLVFRIHSFSPSPDVSRTSPDSYSRSGTLPLSVDVATGSDDTSGGSPELPSSPTWSSFRQSEPPVQDLPPDAEVKQLARVVCSAVQGGKFSSRDQDEAVLLLNVVSNWGELPITTKADIYGRLRIVGATIRRGLEQPPMEDHDPANSEEEETTTDDIPLQVPSSSKNTAPEEGRNNVNPTTEISKCSVGFPSLDHLELHQMGTHHESYTPHENRNKSVNDNGKPLLTRRENVAVEAQPCENIKSSGLVKVIGGKLDFKVGRNYKTSDRMIYLLPLKKSDLNRAELNVDDLRRVGIKRLEELNHVKVDAEGGSERGEESPLGANEREKEHLKRRKVFQNKDELLEQLALHGYKRIGKVSSEQRDIRVDTDANRGSKLNTNGVHEKGKKKSTSDEVKTDEGVRKYVCDSCGKGFRYVGSLKTHLRVHTGEKPFACGICNKRYSTKHSLESHNFSHTGEKPFSCQICCKGFSDKYYLKKHVRSHTGEKPYMCEVCGKTFAFKDYLTYHIRIHTGERSYVCEVCGSRFTQNSILVLHRRTHTGEKPYQCEMCGKKFAQRGNLTIHRRAHTGEKPYVCKACGKSFGGASALGNHLRIHSQVKPHECQVCNKRFSTNFNLKKHFVVHTGERPFACEVCNKSFRDRSNLRMHCRTHIHKKRHMNARCAVDDLV